MGNRLARALAAAVTAPTLLALVACGSGGSGSTTATSGASATAASATGSTTLTVFAAASLNAPFRQIAVDFERAHPGTTVRFTFDGSSSLVDQLQGGAPADVFASADEATMSRATTAGLVTAPVTIFAANTLTLVVAPGNPLHITGLDGSLTDRKLVICAAAVPCGRATDALAQQLAVTLKPVSTEQKVTDVLGKVTSGEADAGLVYATDAKSAGATVATVAIPGAEKVVNRDPIAVVTGSKNASTAQAFIAAVTGPSGQQVLSSFGFQAP